MTTARSAAANAEARLSRTITRIERNLANARLPDDLSGLSPGDIMARAEGQPTYTDIRRKAREATADLQQREREARAVLQEATAEGNMLRKVALHIDTGVPLAGIDPAVAFAAATVRRAVQAGVMPSPAPEILRHAEDGLAVVEASHKALDRIRSAANLAVLHGNAKLYMRAFMCKAFSKRERGDFLRRHTKCKKAYETMRDSHRARFYQEARNG